MFNIWPVRNYFKKAKKTVDPHQDMFDTLTKKGCLDCGSDEFLEGPSGGLATNIKCAGCGSCYNIMPMGWAERI